VRNVYCVKLGKPVRTEPTGHHFTGKETSWLYVLASSFPAAVAAVERKYPGAEIRGVDLVNYTGVPIVLGD
jgi:hypothetical protein